MKNILTIIALAIIGPFVFGQNVPTSFMSYPNKDKTGWDKYSEPQINEINLIDGEKFEFWSRPIPASCLSWQSYNGTWTRENDTIIFRDKYEIYENDAKFTFSKNSYQSKYIINFATDNHSIIENKDIEIQLVYDYDADIEDIELNMKLEKDNSVQINFEDIPNHNHLASLRYEYILDNGQKRYGYITENITINRKEKELPNIIKVTFLEQPKKETIYRTTKGILLENEIKIISTNKTNPTLIDYTSELLFKGRYEIQYAK